MNAQQKTVLGDVDPQAQLQVNDLCNRFEAEWQAGRRPSISEFLKPLPSETRDVALHELLVLDVEYRREQDAPPNIDEYVAEFPELDPKWLQDLIAETSSNAAADTDGDENTPTVMGDYQVVGKIGHGGMGTVYKAVHRIMKRTVALKVIHRDVASDPARRKRFQREVEAAARLSHPNIVTAHDAGEHDGSLYLICEYIDGCDLGHLINSRGPLPFAQAVDCIRQAARGLAYAHQQGVFHRDIKPANLLLAHDGVVKILDMGLARMTAATDTTASRSDLTMEGAVFGTVDYMAPEQARNSKSADQRSDLYSLGCTLFTLLSGQRMYRGDSALEIILAHCEQPAPEISEAAPGIPLGVNEVFQRMVAKEPAGRFQTADELLAALEPFESQPILFSDETENAVVPPSEDPRTANARSTAPPSAALQSTVEVTEGDEAKAVPVAETQTRRPLVWGLVAGTIFAAVLGLLLFWIGNQHNDDGDDPSLRAEANQQWVSLFDGQSLDQWSPNSNPAAWRIEDGAIVAAGEKSSLFYTGNQTPLQNFEVEADVKTTPGSNSGIYFRTQFVPHGFPDAAGYEAQINNSAADLDKTGGIWKYAAAKETPVRDNEWFKLGIRVDGNEITVKVNGEVTTRLTDTAGRMTGDTLALQAFDQQSKVWFRDIRLRRLPSSKPGSLAVERILVVVPHRNFDRSQYDALLRELERLPQQTKVTVASSESTPATPSEPREPTLDVDMRLSDADPADYVTAVFIGGNPASEIEYLDDATPWPAEAAKFVNRMRSRNRIVAGVGAGVAVLGKTGAMNNRPAARPDTPLALLSTDVNWQSTPIVGCDKFVTVPNVEGIPKLARHLNRHLR